MYQKKIEDLFGLRLVPTYSYGRTYERHARLLSHTDRPSCEISATFPIAYETDDSTTWKIWVRNDMNYCGMANKESWDLTMGSPFDERENCIAVELEPGDAMFYQGSNVIHWRERLAGKSARQIFIHYIHKDDAQCIETFQHLHMMVDHQFIMEQEVKLVVHGKMQTTTYKTKQNTGDMVILQ